MHPLSPDLTALSDNDLHKKHGELVNKLNQAYRIGPFGIIGQLQMILQDYQAEIQRRNAKMMDDMARKGKDLGGIIDIKWNTTTSVFPFLKQTSCVTCSTQTPTWTCPSFSSLIH